MIDEKVKWIKLAYFSAAQLKSALERENEQYTNGNDWSIETLRSISQIIENDLASRLTAGERERALIDGLGNDQEIYVLASGSWKSFLEKEARKIT